VVRLVAVFVAVVVVTMAFWTRLWKDVDDAAERGEAHRVIEEEEESSWDEELLATERSSSLFRRLRALLRVGVETYRVVGDDATNIIVS